MSPTLTENAMADLRKAVRELQAAQTRAHPGSTCGTCRAKSTLAVFIAKEKIIDAAERLA